MTAKVRFGKALREGRHEKTPDPFERQLAVDRAFTDDRGSKNPKYWRPRPRTHAKK